MVPKDDAEVDANPTIAGDGSDHTTDGGQGHDGPLNQSFWRRDR
jgi:hypothetical protein